MTYQQLSANLLFLFHAFRPQFTDRKRTVDCMDHPREAAVKVAELLARAPAGERKTQIAKAFGISRETLYSYLREVSPRGSKDRLAA
jgi:DNA invertase Pin-like site-specific DNA recombinase